MDKGPQPSAKDVNGRRGVMLWVIKTAPDEEARIDFGYRITSPANSRSLTSSPSTQVTIGYSLGAPLPDGVFQFRRGHALLTCSVRAGNAASRTHQSFQARHFEST